MTKKKNTSVKAIKPVVKATNKELATLVKPPYRAPNNFYQEELKKSTFVDIKPADLNRYLNFVKARHGDIEYWTEADIMDAVSRACREQRIEQMKFHAIDHASLYEKYAAAIPEDIDQTVKQKLTKDDVSMRMFADAEKAERREYLNCSLTVHLDAGNDPQYFVVMGAPEKIFPLPLERKMLYIKLPFWPCCREMSLSIGNTIYWLNGTVIHAAGVIEKVLLDDVIVAEDGLIVPVIAIPFTYRFTPFCFSPSITEEESIISYQFLNMCIERHVEKYAPKIREIPTLAFEMNTLVGVDIQQHIDNVYRDNTNIDVKVLYQIASEGRWVC